MMNTFTPAPAHDTDTLELLTQSEEVREPSVTLGAENEAIFPVPDENCPESPTPRRTHPVDFEVTTSNADGTFNGLHFLQQLLTNLQRVDGTAELIPQKDASAEFVPLNSIDAIPSDSSAGFFVKNYLGLKPKGPVMKGTFVVQCNIKFETFKKNAAFKAWLVGEIDVYKTHVDRVDLSGANRFQVGRFVNAMVRQDLEEPFKERVIMKIKETAGKRHSGKVPEFAIVCKPWYNKKSQTRMFQMIASSEEDAKVLDGLMSALFPESSKETMFFSEKVWVTLKPDVKSAGFDMHQTFMDDHGVILLKGINDTSLKVKTACGKVFTIKQWLESLRTEDNGAALFSNVFPVSNGDFELWFSLGYHEEAKVRLSTALWEVAKLSGVDPVKEPEKAKAMFKNPSVWRDVETNVLGLTLTDQKKAVSEFLLKIPVTEKVNSASRFRQPPKKKRMQLVFDAQPANNAGSGETGSEPSKKAFTKARKARQRSTRKCEETRLRDHGVAGLQEPVTQAPPTAVGPSVRASMANTDTGASVRAAMANTDIGADLTQENHKIFIESLALQLAVVPAPVILPHGVIAGSVRALRLEEFKDLGKKSLLRTSVAKLTQIYNALENGVGGDTSCDANADDMELEDTTGLKEADTVNDLLVADSSTVDSANTWVSAVTKRIRPNRRNRAVVSTAAAAGAGGVVLPANSLIPLAVARSQGTTQRPLTAAPAQ